MQFCCQISAPENNQSRHQQKADTAADDGKIMDIHETDRPEQQRHQPDNADQQIVDHIILGPEFLQLCNNPERSHHRQTYRRKSIVQRPSPPSGKIIP